MFTKKYQVKWWFFIQIMINFHKKRRDFREIITENVGFGVKKCEKRFWMVVRVCGASMLVTGANK